MTLIHESWQKLQDGVPAHVREALASKSAMRYMAGRVSSDDYAFVCDLFRALAKDVELSVRKTLAYELRYANDIPRDIADRLASDVEDVARPMLHRSPMLNDDFLVRLIDGGLPDSSMEAISQRDYVSEDVGLALISRGTERIALLLAGNKGADITEKILVNTASQFPAAGAVLSVMMERSVITSELAQMIIDHVSTEVGKSLIQRYPALTLKLKHHTASAKDWSMLEYVPSSDDASLMQFVQNMQRQDQLSHSFLIKALCTGQIALFEHGIAQMAQLELANTRRLLSKGSGDLAFRAVCTAAKFPVSMHRALQAVYHIAKEETSDDAPATADYSKRMMQRIMADKLDDQIDNMDVILSMISRNMPSRSAHFH